MLSSTQTVDRTLSLPDATDTLVGKATTDTLTNKTITGGILNGTLGATTPSSVAATTGTFSSTLGVTGVATLGNGAILGTPASGTVTNLTGTASININGTVGATTANTGAFTTVSSTTGANFATSSGSVGIGTASPSFKTEIQQAVAGTAPSLRLTPQLVLKGYNGNSSFHSGIGFSMNEHTNGYWGSGILEVDDSGSYGAALAFYTSTGAALASPSERVRISSSGSVGIGTASPTVKLQVESSTLSWDGGSVDTARIYGTTGRSMLSLVTTDAQAADNGASISLGGAYKTTGATEFAMIKGGKDNSTNNNSAGYMALFTAANNAAPSERMRISSAGVVGIGTTGTTCAGSAVLGLNIDKDLTSSLGIGINTSSASGTQYFMGFGRAGSVCGQIYSTGTNSTTYATSSDYRLKNVIGKIANSGQFIDALKPIEGTWKTDNSKFVGFLAHEFAEVSPSSVGGEKDAVDADGKPVYQSMQASSAEVIANLVAELQSLRKRLAALEA
jgi:hypothetical protein